MRKIVLLLALVVLPLAGGSKAGMLGLTPIANVGPTVTTYTDSTVADGVAYAYWITALAAPCPASPDCGESAASGVFAATIPATGTHSVTLTWAVSTTSGVLSQNVYRVPVPLPPTFTGLTVN